MNTGSIDADLAAFHLRRALRAIDAAWEGSAERFWQRATALGGLERFRDAETALLVIANEASLPPDERARAAATAVAYRSQVDRAVDPLLIRLASVAPCVEVHVERMQLFARKRVRPLADRELAAARALAPASPVVALAEAALHLAFDERLAARDCYTRALAEAERKARLGLSYVAFLLGDFAQGHAALGGFTWGPDDLAVRRRRVLLLQAEHRWSDVAEELTAILASSPRGDRAVSDQLERAAATERAGDAAAAKAQLERLVDEAPDGRDWQVASARRSLALLSRTGGAEGRKRLKGFPTVAQLRNHCGPASCELYLRFLGKDGDQLAIGSEILVGDGGTTFEKIRGYLEKLGLHVLRIEAPLPVVKTLIDLGIPVMLQETYSASGHATVAIGYDDAREVLEVQDPMTHAIRETPYDEVDDLLDMSNHGALIAVTADDRDRLAGLERAGIRECRYMVHVDRAWVALDDARLDDADALLDQAMAERRDYELAWMCRFHVAKARLAKAPTAEHRVALHHVVEAASNVWPEDDWVRAFAATLAFDEGRYGDAGSEYERACSADGHDPRNWRDLGHARLRAGDHAGARMALERALELDASDELANELGAYALFLADEHAGAGILSEVALALAPQNSFNHLIAADLLAKRGDLVGALASYDKAIELDAGRAASTLMRRAELLRSLGRHREIYELLADEPAGRTARIDALLAAGLHDEAMTFGDALAATEETAREGLGLCARVAFLRGDHAGARDRAEALLSDGPSAIAFAIMGELEAMAENGASALMHLAAASVLAPDDGLVALWLGETLASSEQTAAAATQYERALRHLRDPALVERALRGFDDIDDPHRALAIIDEIATEPGRAEEAALTRLVMLTEVAWGPSSAAKLLRERVAQGADDPLTRAQRGLDQFSASIEGEAPGEAVVRSAIAEAPERRYPRWQLAELLNARGRGDEALELVPERDHFSAVRMAITAHCQHERFAEARALLAAFAEQSALAAVPRLEFIIADASADHERALALARELGAADGESEDDAHLDSWELTQYLKLLALDRTEEAIAFGRAQAGTAVSLGMLAHRALAAGYLAGAVPLAEHAVEIDPDEAYAIHVLGRAAEHRGDAAAARALYERCGEADAHWHAYLEELARLAIAENNPAEAVRHAEAAVAQGGHTCFFAVAIRSQARLLAGDLAGARADGLRAYGLGDVGARERTSLDAWATCALLAGHTDRAAALYDLYLADTANAGPLDRARVRHLRSAHARAR